MASGGSSSTTQNEGRMLLLVPLPFQGHLPPMLQLATALHLRGFSITIVHPRFNSPDPSRFPHFQFLPFDDGLQPHQPSKHIGDVITLTKAMNHNGARPFRECVEKLIRESEGSARVRCVISDITLYFTQSVASQLKLPRVGLRTGSATSFLAFAEFLLNRRSPIDQDANSVLQPIREKDIPQFKMTDADEMNVVVEEVLSKTKASSGVIWNTFEELEVESLAEVREEFGIPIFPIGPLHKTSINTSSSQLSLQDQSCMDWLDKQAPNSVLYVSFGSIASLSTEELVETAWGLANSEQRFIWVVRKGLAGDGVVNLPDQFFEETMDRGMVVEWAPQLEVLAHPAVSGFWTHCGWNSTLEGICEGVPLLCWSCYGDQKVNARYASHVWKVGIQLENGLERGEIEGAVRKLMVGKEGEEMRERVKAFKQSADQSLSEGGSSFQNMNGLVEWLYAL